MALVADPGLALFCGLNAMPEEELPQRVFLAPRPCPDDGPVGRLAPRGRARRAVRRHLVQSRFPLGPLLRRRPAGRAPLRLDAQPGAALGARLPGARRRRARVLLFQRRSAQGRRSRRDLPLHRLLEEAPRGASAPPGVRFAPHHLRPPRPARCPGDHLHHAAAALAQPARGNRRLGALGLAPRDAGCARRASTRPRACSSSR